MLKLPGKDTAVRELVDVGFLATLADVNERMKLPTLPQAVANAKRMFAADKAVRNVNTVVMTADGKLKLYQFGPRGGKKALFNFGAF